MKLDQADGALRQLLAATLDVEALRAARDKEIAAVQEKYSGRLSARALEISGLEASLEAFYQAHAPDDRRSIQLAHGLIGMRAPATPALVPLNSRWDWVKVAARVRRLWKRRFFHGPKPPVLDKVRLKRELSAEQLAKCGLKLDDAESFYYELNRLSEAA